MDDVLILKEFFVEGQKHEKSHVILHITEPTLTDKKKGYFFALAEIQNGSRDDIIELEKIFDDLEKSYYNTPHNGEKNSLELSLEFINRRANEVLSESEAEIDCFVGVLENFHLTFSTHGNPVGSLFYTKDGVLQHISIVDSEENNPRQFFSSLTEGDLHTGDSLLLGSSKVIEFFPIDRLEKLISTRSTKESVEHIQKVLKQLRNGNSYGGVLLHSAEKHEVPKTGKIPRMMHEGSVASLKNLIQREKDTSSTLSPPIFHETREKVKSYIEEKKQRTVSEEIERTSVSKIHGEEAPPEKKEFEPRGKKQLDIILSIGTILVVSLKSLLYIILGFFRFIKNFFVGIFILLTNFKGKRASITNDFGLSLKSKKEYIRHLPFVSKVLFSLAICSFLGFVVTASYFKMNEAKKVQTQNTSNLLSAIEEKKNAAEASLLYDDTQRALTLLQEAQGYIATLPKDTLTDQQKIQSLTQEIQASLEKLQKMTLITPEVLTDLAATNPLAKTDRMIKIDNTILITGKADTTLYSLSLENKSVTTTAHDTLPALSANTIPKEQDKVVFVAGDNKIVEFDKKTKALSQKTIAFPVENVVLQSIGMYNRKLYALDAGNNQIFKHTQAGAIYSKGEPWIIDGTDIKNGVSLAIDGDLYILEKNGSLIKLAAGKRIEFSTTGILPALTNPNEIWTNSDAKNLYILESSSKRIVVIEKSGKFVKQFTSSLWSAPTSMVIDEKGKMIYVLDGNKVFGFPI